MKKLKPYWVMFECERGNRWTEVRFSGKILKGFVFTEVRLCTFPHCTNDHTIKVIDFSYIRPIGWYRNMKTTKQSKEVYGHRINGTNQQNRRDQQ